MVCACVRVCVHELFSPKNSNLIHHQLRSIKRHQRNEGPATMTMSTPSPQLSREEQLALWRERKKKKQQTPKIRDSFTSTGERSSVGSQSRQSHYRSIETSSAFKTPYGWRQSHHHHDEDSPFEVPARLSSNISCRKPRLPRRDMSTASSRMKQKSLKATSSHYNEETPVSDSKYSLYQPRKSLSAELSRPGLLFSAEHKENSLVRQIRSRAAKKRGQDGDESSKPESRATTYRTPLTYGDSVATAHDSSYSREGKKGILDISISLPFQDLLLSPLSTTSVSVSPASTISSNKQVNQEEGENEETVDDTEIPSEKATTPVSDGTVPEPLLLDSQTEESREGKQEDDTSLLRSPQSTADSCKVSLSRQTTINVDDTADESYAQVINMATSEIGLDFQGIEDDSSLEENIFNRRRRRRDSTFLRLPRPQQEVSPDPSKSAFVPVERRQSDNSFKKDESPLDSWSSSLSEKSPVSNVAETSKDCASTLSQATQDSSEAEVPTVFLSHNVTKVNDRSILERIPEKNGDSNTQSSPQPAVSSSEAPMLRLEIQTLKEEARVLRISKSTLENKLYTIRHAYEERVTPYRDVFEDVSCLCVACLRHSSFTAVSHTPPDLLYR